ncbi:MAG: galactokinase [Anaerolineae bacterium]
MTAARLETLTMEATPSPDPSLDRFRSLFGRDPLLLVRSPGRVNLIGEHTDYNAGYVLPVAIDRRVEVFAAPLSVPEIRIHSLVFNETVVFPLGRIEPLDPPHWSNYVRAVAWALQETGRGPIGSELLVAGDLPPGAGLGSSAAMETATARALLELSGGSLPAERLARLCQKAEEEFVGVRCGIMDQMASLLARDGHALRIDCRDLKHSWVPVPAEATIVVVDSGRPRRLRDSAYNTRRLECRQAAELLGVETLRDLSHRDLDEADSRLPPKLRRRVRHVVTENERVAEAVGALEDDDLSRMGRLMLESHTSLRDDFEVSTPELDLLVETAITTKGVHGARLTGAGFGGSTVNLVRTDALMPFRQAVAQAYQDATGLRPKIHLCRAAGGISVTSAETQGVAWTTAA